MRGAQHAVRMVKMRNAHIILFEKSEGNRHLERASSRWGDNIRLDLREIRWEGVD
jgi:hypothetical protein